MNPCCHCHCDPCCCVPAPPFPTTPVPLTAPVCQPPTQTGCPVPDVDGAAPRLWEEIDCFNVPAVDSGISVSVQNASNWLVGACVIVQSETESVELRIDAVDAANNRLFLTNLGADTNPAPGTNICPAYLYFLGPCSTGAVADSCVPLNARTAELFVIPDVGFTGNIRLEGCTTAAVGQHLFIQDMGCVEVLSILENSGNALVEVETLSLITGAVPGSIVPSGSYVSPADSCPPDTSGFISTNFEPFSPGSLPEIVFTPSNRLNIDPFVLGAPWSIEPPSVDWANVIDDNLSTFILFEHDDGDDHGWFAFDAGELVQGWFFAEYEVETASPGETALTWRTGLLASDIEFFTASAQEQQRVVPPQFFASTSPIKRRVLIPFNGRYIGAEFEALTGATSTIRFRQVRMFGRPVVI